MTWIINIITTFLLRHMVIQTNIPSAILTKNINISTRHRPTEKLTIQEVLKRTLFSTSKHGKWNNVQTNRQKYKQDKTKLMTSSKPHSRTQSTLNNLENLTKNDCLQCSPRSGWHVLSLTPLLAVSSFIGLYLFTGRYSDYCEYRNSQCWF